MSPFLKKVCHGKSAQHQAYLRISFHIMKLDLFYHLRYDDMTILFTAGKLRLFAGQEVAGSGLFDESALHFN